jgi:hypothetical protein
MIILIVLLSFLVRGDFMQEKYTKAKPLTREERAERERQNEEAARERALMEAERKQKLAADEIICEVVTEERVNPQPPISGSPASAPKRARRMRPRHIGGGILLEPVIDEPEHVSYVKVTFVNHSAARIPMGLFDLRDILEVAVFDAAGNRLSARPLSQPSRIGGYSRSIEPEETIPTQIFLEDFAEIKEPGTYRLDISTRGDVHSLMKIRNRTLTYTI